MKRLLWAAVIVGAVIGVVAATARTIMAGDYITRAESLRQQTLTAMGRTDPAGQDRLAVDRALDAKFVEWRSLTLLHVVPGGLFLLLAPLQLSKRVRRTLTFHRWNGRMLIVLGLLSAVPGLYFGLAMPFGGPAEGVVVALVGGLFTVALVRAYIAIRAKQIEIHREWMLRAFAAAVGISVVRLVAGGYDLWLSPAGWPVQTLFALSLWTGWGLSIGAMELWIRHTRPAIP